MSTPDPQHTPPTPRQGAWLASRTLLAFALVAVALLAGIEQLAAPRIAQAEAADRLRTLQQLLPSGSFNNDLLEDTLQRSLPTSWARPGPQTIWRARQDGQPVAVILPLRAPDGYSGDIDMLLAVRPDGRVAGVRVTQHRETPGLGDAIDSERSDWILQFNDRRLGDPPAGRWTVRKDGGAFDQFTGATITPRAVISAIRAALEYHAAEGAALYAAPPTKDTEPS